MPPTALEARPAAASSQHWRRSSSYDWIFDRSALPATWAVTQGDRSVVIAIVDSGVAAAAPGLAGGVLPGWNAGEATADADDVFGHGTEVASVAGAQLGNTVGVVGACGRCSILPVRVTRPDGTASVATIASGIVWAADHGARVINVSLVTERPSVPLAGAVAYAEARGALVVAAAGNDGLGRPGYPAALPGVLSVEAADRNGTAYAFSNHGAAVSLAAPGCARVATRRGGATSVCGTSVAAPLVAGTAGLLASAYPNATAAQLAASLEQGADRVGDTRFGRLDAARALALLGSAPLAGH